MILVGDRLIGYCGGWFGRDDYEDKLIEAVGADWVVARDARGYLYFAHGSDIHKQLAPFKIR